MDFVKNNRNFNSIALNAQRSSVIFLSIWSMLPRTNEMYFFPSSTPDPVTPFLFLKQISTLYIKYYKLLFQSFYLDQLNINLKAYASRGLTSWITLTIIPRKPPIIVPSSYLPSFSKTLFKTDKSFWTRPTFIFAKVFSIRSSIFVWYLCCK